MRSRDLQDQKPRALRGTATSHWPSQLPSARGWEADILRDRHTQPRSQMRRPGSSGDVSPPQQFQGTHFFELVCTPSAAQE